MQTTFLSCWSLSGSLSKVDFQCECSKYSHFKFYTLIFHPSRSREAVSRSLAVSSSMRSSKPEESVSKHAENHGNQEAQRGVGHHSSDRILPDLAGSRQSSVEVISTCIYCVFFFYLSLFEDVLKMSLLCFAKNISKAKFQCFPNLLLCNTMLNLSWQVFQVFTQFLFKPRNEYKQAQKLEYASHRNT